jgi:PPOX class probable F420-dependent enzyme
MHHRPMATGFALSDDEVVFLAAARTATLATVADDGAPRLVPVCFVVDNAGRDVVIYSPLDDKPKSVVDVRDLARVRDLLARPDVALLVHHWSEDWSAIGWLRLRGTAGLLEPATAHEEHVAATAALRAKYPQYAQHQLDDRPLIRVVVTATTRWGNLGVSD